MWSQDHGDYDRSTILIPFIPTFYTVRFQEFREWLEVFVEGVVRADGFCELIQGMTWIHLLSQNVYLINEQYHGYPL